MKTVGLASYPKLAADDATGEHYEDQDEQGNAYVPTWLVETNTQSCVLHAQLQQQFHGVLQTSFGELEKEFKGKGILHLTVAGSMERTSFWLHLQEMNPGIVSGRRPYKGGGDRFEQSY